jgi:hypothetical protein
MKSGAGDDPFATEGSEDEDEVETDTGPATTPGLDESRSEREEDIKQTSPTTTESASELPYKYRRDSVKDGRTQQPMFLQDETESLIDETVAEIESQFDESVYKTDVVEAMIVAGGEETTPEAVLRRWGYGMKNS